MSIKMIFSNNEAKVIRTSGMIFKSYDQAMGGALTALLNRGTWDRFKPATLADGTQVTFGRFPAN